MVADFRGRLTFDATRGEYCDTGIRYMMIRNDALMGLFAQLPPDRRLPALEALGRSIQEYGGRSAAAYRDMGAADAERMLQTIAETAPQLGWGIWRFRYEGAALVLEVENSPFAAGSGPSPTPVCHAICGMLAAIGPGVMGGPVSVAEERCAAQHGGAVCVFRIALADPT